MHGSFQAAASHGDAPVLHVECHGDDDFGLKFRDGNYLPWHQLTAALTALNRATKLNLFFVIAACYDDYLLREFRLNGAAPCYGILAATESTHPCEILRGFRDFYTALFKTRNAGRAIAAMMQTPLTEGLWFVETASSWYESLVHGYVKEHCAPAAVEERARQLFRRLKASGVTRGIGSIKRGLRDENREQLVITAFDQFFMVTDEASNAERFLPVRRRVTRYLADMRSDSRCWV